MKTYTTQTLQAALVTLILCKYAQPLTTNAWSLYKAHHVDSNTQQSSRQVAFQSASGIDVFGRRLSDHLVNSNQIMVVFLLRGSSILRDISFWREVRRSIPDGAGLILVGFCDTQECANTARKNIRFTEFSVLQYGEVVSAQAIVNADQEGNALVLRDHLAWPRSVTWRRLGYTPREAAGEVMR